KKEISSRFVEVQEFSKDHQLGVPLETDFIHATLFPVEERKPKAGQTFYLTFKNFDGAVKEFLNIKVDPETKGSSVLKLQLNGENKARLVDYLNTSIAVLSEDMLERKNLFATKTIRFIDSSLAEQTKELKEVEDELNTFKDQNAIYNLQNEGQKITERLNTLDLQKEAINRELSYYNTLENYLITRTDYRDVPAPSVAGISEASIVRGVSQIVDKAQDRSKLEYSYKEGSPIFKDIDRQIDAIKRVLQENITSSKGLKNQEIARINSEIYQYESEIRKLPKDQQELLKIERRYKLSQGTYDLFLAKRSEAGLVKAANVSDVLVIDMAKDTGGGQVGPNTQLNYVMA
ncbi:MAG TPA: sugar transporter, partial [Flavobacteriaceae bacterium]|nr:sugar transporter [Flavobacteriaceae bacterium]